MTYDELRDRVLPGDVIAFGGDGIISTAIKLATRSPVSHVGIVHYCSEAASEHRVMVLEVTSLQGEAVAQHHPLSFHIERYRGRVWWLPLGKDARRRFDEPRFQRWGTEQLGRPYDFAQAIGSAVDLLPDMHEDLALLFCSELVAQALEVGRAIPMVNASEQTPQDVIRFGIYSGANQLRGEPLALGI